MGHVTASTSEAHARARSSMHETCSRGSILISRRAMGAQLPDTDKNVKIVNAFLAMVPLYVYVESIRAYTYVCIYMRGGR